MREGGEGGREGGRRKERERGREGESEGRRRKGEREGGEGRREEKRRGREERGTEGEREGGREEERACNRRAHHVCKHALPAEAEHPFCLSSGSNPQTKHQTREIF